MSCRLSLRGRPCCIWGSADGPLPQSALCRLWAASDESGLVDRGRDGAVPAEGVHITMSDQWRNRIIDEAVVPARDLVPNPRNWRTHPKPQQAALSDVLGSVGWVQRVIVNRTTGHIVDGHLRVGLALKTNDDVPVSYVELSEAEEALILATFDPIGAMATTDPALLDAVLRDVDTSSEAIQHLLTDVSERSGVIPPAISRDDLAAEWQGMPEFEQADQKPVKQVTVSFASVEDLVAFARLMEQTVTLETRSIWFPVHHRKVMRDLAYVGADDES